MMALKPLKVSGEIGLHCFIGMECMSYLTKAYLYGYPLLIGAMIVIAIY